MTHSLSRLRKQERGSLLLTAAISASVVAILIGGMLTYISNEYVFNVRSHRWSQALGLAEAGVEMGFAEFNNYYIKGTNGFSESRGWSGSGGTYSRFISSFVDASGQNVGNVYAYVNGVGTAYPYVFAYGGCNTTPRGPWVYRAVESRLVNSARFPAAMVSKNQMDLKGSNFFSDSFDSTDPNKSTDKLYDVNKRQANGDIATNSQLIDSLNAAASTIYGIASTGPNGTMSLGNNGTVGPTFNSSERAQNVAEGEAKGWIRHDFAVDIPDVELPPGMASAPVLGTGQVSTTTEISGGDYRVSSIKLGTGDTLTIKEGTVRLYVTGETTVSGQAQIIIEQNAKLELYAAGNMSIAGQGVLNKTGSAINNQFYGLPSSTFWDITGNGIWLGTIYAPQADLKMAGGGSAGDMGGSVVSNTITLSGGTKFHYDESLKEKGPSTGYNIASWKSYRWNGSSWAAD